MILNPELRRNFWLELSAQRLIAMPVLLGLVFWIVGLNGGESAVSSAALIAFHLIVYFWGTRRAASAIATELNSGTWDDQCMSPIAAWPMGWGKLLGSTAYVWFGGAICISVFFGANLGAFFYNGGASVLSLAVILVLIGLLGHGVALALSLMMLRKQKSTRRVPVSVCQIAGLIAIYGLSSFLFVEIFVTSLPSANVMENVLWFGGSVTFWTFTLATMISFVGWALLAIYRLMQSELQYQIRPFAWLGFTVFLMIYGTGLLYERLLSNAVGIYMWLALPLFVAVLAFYIAFFLAPKNIVLFRKWLAAVLHQEWAPCWRLTPVWFQSFGLLWLVGAILIVMLFSQGGPVTDRAQFFGIRLHEISAFYVLAALLFVTRDLIFLLWLNLTGSKGKPDLAGAIYLLVLYSVLPPLLGFVGGASLLPIVIPYPTDNLLWAIGPVSLQVFFLVLLCRKRWSEISPQEPVFMKGKV